MFALKTITECELTAFTGHTRKEGKDDIPAVSIRLRIKGVPNEELDKFSSTLRPTIYMAVPGQEDLPGMPPSTPLLRSKDVTHLPTEFRYEGWKVWIARGMNDDALHMEQCKVDAFSFDFYEGGKMDYEFRISTADLDEEGAGMLWGRQKRKVFVRIEAPELPAAGERTEATGAEIDGTKGHPGAADANQGSLLDDQAQTPEGALAASLGADPGEGDPDEFSDDEGSSTDAGAAEQAELEAGMAQSIAAAGVAPKGVRRGRKPGAEVH